MVGSTVLFGDDMIDVEREEIAIVCVDATILAAISGTASNERPECGIHHAPEKWASLCRAFDLSIATNVP